MPYLSLESVIIGPIRVYIWGFFLALAFLVGLILTIKQFKKFGLSQTSAIYLVMIVYAGSLIGSRLLYGLQWPTDFFKYPGGWLDFSSGGLMLYGGIFGGLITGWAYLKSLKSQWLTIERLVPIIPVCLAIGRLGCLLTSDHPGRATNWFWAMRWFDGSLRHPVALYLILFDLLLVWFLWRRQKRHSGGSLILFFMLYAGGRFFLDFTRDPLTDPHYLWLSASQWISLAVFLVVMIVAVINREKIAWR